MILDKEFTNKKEILADGVWIDHGESKWLLTYYNSTKAEIFFTAACKKYKAAGLNDVDVIIEAMNDTLIEIVVLDFKNVRETSDEGIVTELLYSKEELRRLLNMYDGLGSQLMNLSLNIGKVKKEQVQETRGK